METTEAVRPKSNIELVEHLAKIHGIKKLKAGETVTYIPARMTTLKNGKPRFPVSMQIPSRTTIINPETKDAEPLVYVKSEIPKYENGVSFLVEDTPNIYLEGGQKTLGVKDNRLYMHMEMLDQNGSKPGRDTSVAIKFYRVDKAKTAKEAINEIEIEYDAVYLARTMPFADAKEYATRLGIYDPATMSNRTSEEVRHNLILKAKESPRRFIRESRNARGMAKLIVTEAIAYKILTNDEFNWKWIGEANPEKEIITKVDQDLEPIDGLVKYFLNDTQGKRAYKELEKKLNKV